MNPLDYIKNLDHHAYFIHSFENAVEKVKDFLKKKFGFEHKQNPDFFHEKYETLSIDESRKIKELHASKSFLEGSRRIFIIESANITHEAQNSLLKIFEEPHEYTHFFLIMPSVNVLLPTLRSRLHIIQSEDRVATSEALSTAKKFLALSKKDKVAFVDDIAKDISDEKAEKSQAIEFLSALEVLIYKKDGLKSKDSVRALEAIAKARDYMNDRSPSIKQLLEYVALSL